MICDNTGEWNISKWYNDYYIEFYYFGLSDNPQLIMKFIFMEYHLGVQIHKKVLIWFFYL